MENAANSLKIAFAIIMLVLAITLTFVMISRAKETADTVFFVSDETNYYDMESIKKEDYALDDEGYRVVGKDTVTSTLYRLYDESLTVVIKKSNGSIDKSFSSSDYSNSEEAYKDISEYCKSINETSKFIESFQEIKTSGTYAYADDGSELTLTPGGTRIYITYKYK